MLYGIAAIAQQRDDSTKIKAQLVKALQMQVAYPDSALVLLQATLKESEAISFPYGIGSSISCMAVIYADKGMYAKAIATDQGALPYFNKMPGFNAKKYIPYVYNAIGTLYKMQGDYNPAIDYYNLALAAHKNLSIPVTPDIYNNLGAVLLTLKRMEQALYYFDKAVELGTQQHMYETVINALMNKGVIFEYQGKHEQGRAYLESALKASREHNFTNQMQYLILTNLAQSYVEIKKPEKALFYLSQAQAVKGDVNPYNQAFFWTTTGGAYLQLHEYSKAEQYFLKIVQLGNSGQTQVQMDEAYQKLSDLYEQTGRYQKALETYKKAVIIQDSNESQNITNNFNQLDVKYRTSEKDKQLAQNQLQISKGQLQISKQEASLRQKNLWIACISFAALLLILLYRSNQHKQRLQGQKLKAMQQQQEIVQLRAVMKGEENERGRLARELHDGIGGMLSSINMNLNIAREEHPEISNIKRVDEAMNMLQDTAAEVRKTAHNLMPDILVRHHLQDALIIFCENINSGGRLQINLQCNGPLEVLDKSIELIIYRIVQELLQNTIKHAHATRVDVLLALYDNTLTVNIEDNGIGFNVREHHNGYGLQNLQYRVQALQGVISIMAEKGTIVCIEFDLENLKSNITV